jgi:hypothetical protein
MQQEFANLTVAGSYTVTATDTKDVCNVDSCYDYCIESATAMTLTPAVTCPSNYGNNLIRNSAGTLIPTTD